jgi:hypothetical protein
MTIEIVIGLPHLNAGPILARARSMVQPALISANALSRWSKAKGWPEWRGWRLAQLANAHGLASLDLDNAGFVAMKRYGGYAWSVDDYFRLASAFPLRRIASLDYCTEHEIAGDREEVLDRISRTIRANRDCRDRARDLGLADRFMPVLQGRMPSDYERCAEGLWWSMQPGAVVGVGSMCRREVAGPSGLVAVVAHLDRILPAGVRLHILCIVASVLQFHSHSGVSRSLKLVFKLRDTQPPKADLLLPKRMCCELSLRNLNAMKQHQVFSGKAPFIFQLLLYRCAKSFDLSPQLRNGLYEIDPRAIRMACDRYFTQDC